MSDSTGTPTIMNSISGLNGLSVKALPASLATIAASCCAGSRAININVQIQPIA